MSFDEQKNYESIESEVISSAESDSSNKTNKRALREWFGIGREQYESLQQTIMSMDAEINILIDQSTSANVDDQLGKLLLLKEELKFISSKPDLKNSWQRVNGVEKKLVSLYPTERISAELHRRLAEASREQAGFVDFYRGRTAVTIGDDKLSMSSGRDHDVLQMLLTDLHWFYNKRFLKRLHSQYAINKVSFVFFLSFTVFVLVLAFLSSPDQPIEFESASSSNNSLNIDRLNLEGVE